MQYLEAEIVSLTQYIWSATLGLEAEAIGRPTPDTSGETRTLDGVISVSGAWQGTVVVQVSQAAAAQAAARMFDLTETSASLQDMQDAVGELTNMTGGNIKALMEGHCFLSLPTVVEGHDYRLRVPGSETVTHVGFVVDGEPFAVSLLTRRAA